MDRGSSKGPAEQALFAGEAWFDPTEAGLRDRIRGLIEELVEQELEATLGARALRALAQRPGTDMGTGRGDRPAPLARSRLRLPAPGSGLGTETLGSGAAPCCRATPDGPARPKP